MANVHDYFFNRGVPGLADIIPSASEPVFYFLLLVYLFLTIKSTRKNTQKSIGCNQCFFGNNVNGFSYLPVLKCLQW